MEYQRDDPQETYMEDFMENENVVKIDPNNVESPSLQKNVYNHRLRDIIKNNMTSLLPKKSSEDKPKKKYRFVVGVIVLTTLAFLITFMFMFNSKTGDHFAIGNNEQTVVQPDGTTITKPITSPSLNAAYFTMTTLSSVGYGDICPKSKSAKLLTSLFQFFAFSVSVGAIYIFSDHTILNKVKKIKFA